MNTKKAFNNFLTFTVEPLVAPMNIIQAAYHDNVQLIDGLLKRHGDKVLDSSYKESGNTALHVASKKGNLKSVQFLLDKGADYLLQNSSGQSTLDVAIKYHHTHIIELLKNHSLDSDNYNDSLDLAGNLDDDTSPIL